MVPRFKIGQHARVDAEETGRLDGREVVVVGQDDELATVRDVASGTYHRVELTALAPITTTPKHRLRVRAGVYLKSGDAVEVEIPVRDLEEAVRIVDGMAEVQFENPEVVANTFSLVTMNAHGGWSTWTSAEGLTIDSYVLGGRSTR